MDGQVVQIMNTNEVEGLADPSLQQYECSLYTEKDERDVIQKKTFTKWVNKHLIKSWRFAKAYLCSHGCCSFEPDNCCCFKDHKGVEDLFEDLRDGHNLLTLLEVLSGEHLSREKGYMRVHMLQNVQIALNFLKNQRIKLVNIRPEDIVDGNPKLTLGLIWTIILHYQISDIIQHEENELPKEILLKWAQMTTEAYPNVYIKDFTNSWKDGLAFLAILHRNKPDLINFTEKINKPIRENLELAFNIYEKSFNICRLLDPEDVDTCKPDEKSLITYISSIYELFKEPPEFNPFKDVDYTKKINNYTVQASSLINWIKDKTIKLNDLSWRGKANIILHQLYDDLQDFHDKELPICLKENQKLKELYKSISKMNLQNEIPENLNQSEIEFLINKMMNAFNLRQNAIKEDLKRAQIIAEKIVDESEICHLNLEEIKSLITEQSERIERLNEEDNIKNFEHIKKNLDDEEKRLEFMSRNLEILDQLSYHHYDELDKKVKQLKNLHDNLLNQFDLKLISQFEFKKQQMKKQEELEKEHKKLLKKQQLLQQQFEEQQKLKPLTEEELIASNLIFKAIAEYIKNYETKLAELNNDYFVFATNTFNLNKQLEKIIKDKEKVEDNFNQFIIDSNSSKSQISKVDLTVYDNLVLKLEKTYNDLCENLDFKEKQLKELIDFLEPAEIEFKWLSNHEEIEINRDWSSTKQLDLKQLDKHHRQLIATMNDREDQFTEILDKGENLIKQNHEAADIIQNQMNNLQLQWSWLLQLTNCLETHMKNIDFSQNFYQKLDECNDKFDLIDNSLQNIDCKQSENSIEQGEKLLTEIHKIKDDIHQYAQSIKDVALKCKKVIPYKARRQPLTKPIKVTSACMIKQVNSTIEQDEQCVLIDNSTKAKWTVKTNDSKEITAPGCCFVFCPPDKQAIELTENLKKRCENLSNIWASKEHRLRKNMIIATLNVVKSWDFNTYNKMDSEQRSVILLALESDIEKLSQNEPKNIINDESDELDGESLKSSNGNDCKSLSEQMSLLKTRFKEFDLRIENELNDKNKQNENLEKYYELNDQVVVELTEKKNILLQRAQDAIPRDPEQFDQLVLDHKLLQNEYDQLNERVEEINILFNQMDKKPFEVQSKHNSLTMLFSHTGDLIDLYTQRLHEIGNILSSYDECLDAISSLEIKIALLDDMPADENALNHLLENNLKEIEKKLKHSHSQFDNLQLYLNNLKQIIDKTRSKQSSNVDLLRLEEDIKSLNIRWETLNKNLIKFKSAIEHYSNLLINYRTKMDHERVWLSQLTSQVTSSIVNNDIEAINMYYDDLLKRESQIQELNVLSICLIRDAQTFDKRLKEYKDDLEDVHPSLDANLNSKSPQTVTGSDQIANDFDSLQAEYNNLCDTIVNYLNDLEEEHRRITEEAAELEELQMEIAIKEMTDLCDNLQKIADWLNTMEKVYEQPIQCSRIMETLKSQIEEEKNILNEIENQKININQIQEKANELNSFNQEEDYQILPDNIINVIIPDAITSLENLNEKVLERIEKLQLSVKESQEFNKSLNVLRAWLEQQKVDQQLNETINISNDSTKLKEMLLKHKEFQRKLNAKQAIYDVVMKIGRSLKDKSSKDEIEIIQGMLNDLKNEWTDVCNKSIDRQRKLEEALLVAGQFKDALQALFDWIDKAKENLIDDCVFGDRETVVHLIEAHHLFQEDLKNHAKNLNQVRKFCNELCQAAEGNYQQIGNIPDQLDELENKWEELNKLSDSKEFQLQDALEHSEKLQKSITELFNWLNEVDDKLRLLDQLPDDVEILKQQINEHEKFMNKLNEQETIKQKSISLAKETLIKCHPDAVSVINHWISTIETLWLDVTNHSKQRETKLKEHSEKLKEMFKLLDELHAWLVTSETDLIVADSEFMPDEIDILEKLIESHNEFIDQMSGKQKDIEKIARTFSTKKVNISSNQNNSAAQISDFKRKAGGASFTAQFHNNSSSNHYSTLASLKQEEIRNPKAKDLIEKWRSVWLLSIEHKRRLKDQLEHCKEMEKMKTFEFDEWRSRFLNWLKNKKARVLDFFKQMDTDNDGKLTREQFIEGFLKSKFTTSRMELEYVTPIFDRNNDGMIGQKEYLDTLRPDRDILKTDNEIIQNEVHAQVAKCTCPHKYKVFQVEEGKYSFGESQKLCLVRILRSTVMVRVGGGWASLDEFLVKHDPCRARGRTNVELREQFILANGVSQSMTPFITKLHSSANSHAGSIKGSLNDLLPQFPTTGPITKIREKTERSVPMCFNKYYSRSKSNTSVNGLQNGNSTNGHIKNNGHVITCSEHSKNGKLKTSDLNSDGSFTETDSGTKSRPRSRMTLNSTGSRTPNSRPASRSASRPPSRVGSDMSTESLETYKHLNKTNKIQHSTPSNKRYLVTPSGIKRTLSYGSASSVKERWK